MAEKRVFLIGQNRLSAFGATVLIDFSTAKSMAENK
jgi:hypothetical protein